MQILLAILIAAAASEVQSAGFACSKCPILSNLYSLAQNISSSKIPVTPLTPDSSSGENSLQRMNDKIIHFKNQYEVAETEVDCKSLLCDQKLQFLREHDMSYMTVVSIFEDYNAEHENYVEQLGRGFYNLSSEYCQAAVKKIQEIVDLANPLNEKLGIFVHGNFRTDFDYFNSVIRHEILDKFDGTDKTKCRYLIPEFLNCIGRDFPEDHFEELPQELQNQVDYFLERCNKNKHELESMKGPGIDCD